MDFLIPPAPLLAGLLSSLTLPVLLIAFSHRPLRIAQSHRYQAALLGMTAIWLLLLLLLPGDRPVLEVLAGALILPTAGLIGFSVWTLTAHGFTISMLLSLVEAGRPLSMDDWIAAYGGAGLEAFARDRLQVLFRFGMAVQVDGAIRATPRGVFTGRLVWYGLLLFNIADTEVVT